MRISVSLDQVTALTEAMRMSETGFAFVMLFFPSESQSVRSFVSHPEQAAPPRPGRERNSQADAGNKKEGRLLPEDSACGPM